MIGRFLVITMAAACATAEPSVATAFDTQAPSASEQTPFQFRELHVGASRPKGREKDQYRRCEKLVDTVICTFANDTRVGNIPVFGEARFQEEGFSELVMDFGASEVVRSALLERYGKPCSTTTAEVQNGYGARFTRDTITWCFSDGKAFYQSVGTKIGVGTFRFASRSVLEREAQKPKVDF